MKTNWYWSTTVLRAETRIDYSLAREYEYAIPSMWLILPAFVSSLEKVKGIN